MRKFFISSSTKEERKSGFAGEKGEMERGGRLLRALLHDTDKKHIVSGQCGCRCVYECGDPVPTHLDWAMMSCRSWGATGMATLAVDPMIPKYQIAMVSRTVGCISLINL